MSGSWTNDEYILEKLLKADLKIHKKARENISIFFLVVQLKSLISVWIRNDRSLLLLQS